MVFGSTSKDWDDIRQFIASLECASENSSAIASKIGGGKSTNHSVERAEQKEKGDIVVLDLDGNSPEHNKLASEMNKELGTSVLASNIAERMATNGSQTFETVHAYGGKNMQIVPYGQGSALVNQFPLQTSWQPSIQFERVVLTKRPEEQRMQDLVVHSNSSLLN